MAQIFEANALRAIGRLVDARAVFNDIGKVEELSNPWLQAFYLRVRGTLEADAQKLDMAIDLLARGAELLQALDPHTANLTRVKLAEAFKWQGKYQQALETFNDLRGGLDDRRWPAGREFMATEYATHLITVEDYDRAEGCLPNDPQIPVVLSHCQGIRGAVRLIRGDCAAACQPLRDAVDGLLAMEKYDSAVAFALHLAEAYAQMKDLPTAMATVTAALTYNVTGNRAKQTLQALRMLVDYSGSAEELARNLRRLAWQCGGALPPPRD
jgi:tetratricopeptide (TPR) repeat protein